MATFSSGRCVCASITRPVTRGEIYWDGFLHAVRVATRSNDSAVREIRENFMLEVNTRQPKSQGTPGGILTPCRVGPETRRFGAGRRCCRANEPPPSESGRRLIAKTQDRLGYLYLFNSAVARSISCSTSASDSLTSSAAQPALRMVPLVAATVSSVNWLSSSLRMSFRCDMNGTSSSLASVSDLRMEL